MTRTFLPWLAAAALTAALSSSSCTYDPYYSSAGGSYGYGQGYGYGGSSFSTSFFVSTGDPGWGYDPYTYCYYDYRRRCYYDPYLYGYYPIGYRPPVIIGVPHPYGWRPGHGHCPPPRKVRNITVVNYQNREAAYRNSQYSWARNVRQRDSHEGMRPRKTSDYRRPPQQGGMDYSPQQGFGPRPSAPVTGRYPGSAGADGTHFQPSGKLPKPKRNQGNPEIRPDNPGRLPGAYNTPVAQPPTQKVKPERFGKGANSLPGLQKGDRPNGAPTPRIRGTEGRPAFERQGNGGRSDGDAKPAKESRKGLRSLGEG
jgi:hypothetical protein